MKTDKKQNHFYGGQAVMEGVMMRGKSLYSMAVRKPDKEIAIVSRPIKSSDKLILKAPIIRGIVAFGSSLSLGMKTLTESAEIATEGEEEDPSSRFERFLQDKFGDKVNDVLIQISVVLAIAIALLLFVFLPLWIGSGLTWLMGSHSNLLGVIEGFARLLIFLTYVLLISRSKEIRRVFQYHGAEHKTINGYEQKAELTVEKIKEYSRLHNRCGTSFLLIVMVISILVFTFVQTPNLWMRMGSRLMLIPIIAGLAFEVIRWAGRSQGPLVKIISFPGLMLQRLTTLEPDDDQIEVAISALKSVLAEEAKEEAKDEVKEGAEEVSNEDSAEKPVPSPMESCNDH